MHSELHYLYVLDVKASITIKFIKGSPQHCVYLSLKSFEKYLYDNLIHRIRNKSITNCFVSSIIQDLCPNFHRLSHIEKEVESEALSSSQPIYKKNGLEIIEKINNIMKIKRSLISHSEKQLLMDNFGLFISSMFPHDARDKAFHYHVHKRYYTPPILSFQEQLHAFKKMDVGYLRGMSEAIYDIDVDVKLDSLHLLQLHNRSLIESDIMFIPSINLRL